MLDETAMAQPQTPVLQLVIARRPGRLERDLSAAWTVNSNDISASNLVHFAPLRQVFVAGY